MTYCKSEQTCSVGRNCFRPAYLLLWTLSIFGFLYGAFGWKSRERNGQRKSVSKVWQRKWNGITNIHCSLFLEGISGIGKRCQPGKNSRLSNLHVCNSQSETKIKLERELERNFGTEMVFLSIILWGFSSSWPQSSANWGRSDPLTAEIKKTSKNPHVINRQQNLTFSPVENGVDELCYSQKCRKKLCVGILCVGIL